MKYLVELNGEKRGVELEGAEGRVGDRQFTARLEEIEGTPVRIVTVGNQVHRVVMRRGATRGSYTLWVDGWRFDGDALDERTRAIREITAAASKSTGPAPVLAPMPGMIVRVSIAVGDQVQAGQGLVVMEAMKMENELRASASGRVKSILASPGTAVEKGTLLVELEAVTP